jgi:RNA polymerase sigma-70 factor (ECF subfamily)
LYRVAYHRLGDADLAADGAQNALVNVWKNLDRVDNPASFVWWALKILDNEVNQLLRAGRRRAAALPASDLHGEGSDDAVEWLPGKARLNGSASDQAPAMTDDIRDQLERAIRHCLDNPQHQAVIIKNYLDDKSYQDIAAELDTTPQNVAVYKQRGLRRLRACDEFLVALEALL